MSLPTIPDDRLRAAFEAAVASILPQLKAELAFYAQWECRVLTVTPATPPATVAPYAFVSPASVSAVPTNAQGTAILGPVVNIPLAPGPDGAVSVPSVGSVVRVAFANADPGKPYIASLDPVVGPTVSLAYALRILATANSATWMGTPAFLAAVGVCG